MGMSQPLPTINQPTNQSIKQSINPEGEQEEKSPDSDSE
jgi:hypothetical protein